MYPITKPCYPIIIKDKQLRKVQNHFSEKKYIITLRVVQFSLCENKTLFLTIQALILRPLILQAFHTILIKVNP